MNEKTIMVGILLSVLAVGLVGTVKLTAEQTGQVVRTTVHQPRGGCCCEIEKFDYYGTPIGTEIHPLRVKSAQARTDSACNNRCGIHFGKSKRGRKQVSGFAC